MTRVVEAYVGEYASGKSEVAVNRALEMVAWDEPVTLVDLDLVEPCYTLRPIKKELQALGVDVIAWETGDSIGWGETGNILKAEAKWALRRPGNIVFDVGYGVDGAKSLNLVEGLAGEPSFKVIIVINISRPMTAGVDDIVALVKGLDKVDGLINNTHLGDETTPEVVQEGARVVTSAARKLGLPVIATTAVKEIAAQLGSYDAEGNLVRPLKRYMPRSFW
ncbi:MAG: hypothetical protein H0Z39_01330 [Peptococcaceae bacterium]|nr:hypothetical protein [Peptococcaceae bacterium]